MIKILLLLSLLVTHSASTSELPGTEAAVQASQSHSEPRNCTDATAASECSLVCRVLCVISQHLGIPCTTNCDPDESCPPAQACPTAKTCSGSKVAAACR